jgi:hypothetical protein
MPLVPPPLEAPEPLPEGEPAPGPEVPSPSIVAVHAAVRAAHSAPSATIFLD